MPPVDTRFRTIRRLWMGRIPVTMRWSGAAWCVLILVLLTAVDAPAQDCFDVALDGDLDRMNAMLADDPGLVGARSGSGKTPLHYAAQGGHAEMVTVLLEAGAEIDSANDVGERPLHYAAAFGHDDVVRVLLANDAEAMVFDINRNTPLHYAAMSGGVEGARMLVGAGADVNASDFYGYKPLDVAFRSEQPEMCRFLEAQGAARIAILDPEVTRLSDTVFRILFPFGDRSNIALSAGGDGLLLVDTGFSARAVEKLEETLSDLGKGPLKMIINTHLHPDHIAGNAIGGDEVQIVDFNNLEEMAGEGVLMSATEPIVGRTGKTFDPSYTMTFNDEEIRLIPYAGIHTDADLLVHFTRSGVVHMGDMLILQSFPSVTRKADEYLEFLETVMDIFPETTRFICGHGREGTLADIADYHLGLSAAAEIIRSALAAGLTTDEILGQKSLDTYDSWGEFIPILDIEYWVNAVEADFIEDSKFTDLTGPRFGQEPPGLSPEVFGSEAFNQDFHDFNPIFTPDGNEFYFTQSNDGHYTIKVMYRIEDRWTRPVVADFSGTYSDCDMVVDHDGGRMFFSSDRPFPGSSEPAPALFIWVMDRVENEWGEPQMLGSSVNTGGRACYPTTTRSGTLYFQSTRETGFGEPDVYRAPLVDGGYPTAENLGPSVNTEYPEMDNVIAPDESYLIVSSKRPTGLGGSDLYISFKTEDGGWTEMINMGERVNSPKGEGCPMVTHDGEVLFFISSRSSKNENYWVDTGVIEELRAELDR